MSHPALETQAFAAAAAELTQTVRFLHSSGWAPATSSNYSFRLIERPNEVFISRSGIDKSLFTPADLLLIDPGGKVVAPLGATPSAETHLHTLIYALHPTAQCVLHTHSVNNTVLSMAHATEGKLEVGGFEILKGLKGITSHHTSIVLPVFANSQDMPMLAEEIGATLAHHPDAQGFLLAGHGLYTWGTSIADARRHVEVFEFLFECVLKLNLYRPKH